MRSEVSVESKYRRLLTDATIASVGAVALSTSINILVAFNASTAEIPAVISGGVLAGGVVAYLVDSYRLRTDPGDFPSDPAEEDIEPLAEIIELQPHQQTLNIETLAA